MDASSGERRVLTISPNLQIPMSEIEFKFVRSSGPGGQNVNKVASKAILRWSPVASRSLPDDVRERFVAAYRSRLTRSGELILTSDRYRDQGRNTADCLARLRTMLGAVAKPPKRRKRTGPTRAAKARRLAEKQRRSTTKELRQTKSLGGDD
jgi:ribosome-associated protein